MNKRVIEMKRLFSEGYTPTMVADMIGINRKSIHYYINTYNLEVVNKHRSHHCNDNYFLKIDSEKKAYLLGFIIADGCISKDNRLCFANSEDDESILQIAKDEISPDSKIIKSYYQQGVIVRKPQVRLRIKSNIICSQLKELYNIDQNKTMDSSFSFNLDLIPDIYVSHFIRGFFDGDGSVSFHTYKNTIFFNFSFISTSLVFLTSIGTIFEEKFKIKQVVKEIQGKTVNYYTLRFNYNRNRSSKIEEIYNYLYKDSTVFLERKRIKFQNYLEYRANSTNNIVEQCNA
jgi:hypothetical protein